MTLEETQMHALNVLLKAGRDALERKTEPPRALAAIEAECPSRDERLDASLLESPWHISEEWRGRILDRRGSLVARFQNEDAALLIVTLVNRLPANQATTDV